VLPDIHFTLEDVIAEGDTVVVRWAARGTHQGDWEMELGTIPASGKVTTTPGTSSFYLRDGKIIRDVNHIDFVSLLQQIGARIEASAVERL
jgi:predicted ester cyclase